MDLPPGRQPPRSVFVRIAAVSGAGVRHPPSPPKPLHALDGRGSVWRLLKAGTREPARVCAHRTFQALSLHLRHPCAKHGWGSGRSQSRDQASDATAHGRPVRTPGRVTGRYNTSPAQWDPSGAAASLVVLSRPVEDLQLDLFGPLAVEGVALMRDPATARRRALGPVHGFRPGCAHGSPIRASCSGAMGLRPRSSPDDTSHYSVQ